VIYYYKIIIPTGFSLALLLYNGLKSVVIKYVIANGFSNPKKSRRLDQSCSRNLFHPKIMRFEKRAVGSTNFIVLVQIDKIYHPYGIFFGFAFIQRIEIRGFKICHR
jgi:hypothetical protein